MRTLARGSSAQSPADVLHEDEVEVVGRAGLELGREMQVEISRSCIGPACSRRRRRPRNSTSPSTIW